METKWEIMRRTSIENIDEIIANLVYELSENYFGHVNYAVHFNATPIQLKNEPLNIKELLKPYITITNELNCRKYELERINIQHAKALLKKEILSNDPQKSKEHLKIGFKRLDKLWQLISHYVSFYESEIYYYDNFTEIGIFWNYMLLIIDEKSNYAFLLTAGAWD